MSYATQKWSAGYYGQIMCLLNHVAADTYPTGGVSPVATKNIIADLGRYVSVSNAEKRPLTAKSNVKAQLYADAYVMIFRLMDYAVSGQDSSFRLPNVDSEPVREYIRNLDEKTRPK